MEQRYIIIFVFLMSTGSFSTPVIVLEVFEGGSAIFPCNIEDRAKTQDIQVHWRDSFGRVVFINGGNVKDQDPEYKNRVKERDDCSIELNNLRKSDKGAYTGYITDPLNKKINIFLNVKDKPEENAYYSGRQELTSIGYFLVLLTVLLNHYEMFNIL